MANSNSVSVFLRYVKQVCEDNDIQLKIGRGKLVRMRPYNFKVAGYFDEDSRLLHCGKGSNETEFLSTLVHEFAHVLQWIEKDINYRMCDHQKHGSVQNAVCMWVNNEINISQKKLESYTQKVIACELNAERRAIKIIREFNLPIDTKKYCEHASATLYTYWLTLKTKKWDFIIGPKQRAASGSSLRRSFKSLPKNVETSFLPS